MNKLNNYKKELRTVNLVWANIFSLLILIPIFLIFGVPYCFIWGFEVDFIDFQPPMVFLKFLYVFIIIISGIIVHELIHGITWAIFSKNGFKSIKFGILFKMLTPYCHCKEPLRVRDYIIGAIMPAIVLGIIPSLIAIIIGNLSLLSFGMFFTMAAAGDFLIINVIRKENKDDFVQDHPSEAGCYIYKKIE